MLLLNVRSIAILLLFASFTLAGCSGPATAKEDIPLVRTQTIRTEAGGQSASYSGEVRGKYETQLAFQVGGKIIRRNVELGSAVNHGDILMEIDSKDIQQTVNMSSAQVASAESQLSLAKANLERYRQLYEQGAVSKAQLDQYQNAYDLAAASVQQATAQYTQGSNMLGYSALQADGAGVISGVSAEAGQVVSAGQPVLTLVKGDEREIEIFVPEHRIEEMRQAQQVKISYWALPGAVSAGRVKEISPVADKVARTYKVRISVNNPPAGLKLGMTASVTTMEPNTASSIYIPLSAIYQTGDAPCVWVVQNGAVTLRRIKTGDFGDGKVQVLAGLNSGDAVVTAGVQKLREGQKVRGNE